MSDESNFKIVNDNLIEIKILLKQLIAIQLYNSGATQDEISSNLQLSKTTTNRMVKGVKRDKLAKPTNER